MNFSDLLKEFKADNGYNDSDAYDNEMFEQWKMKKRRQFKEGTRASFINAYNIYEVNDSYSLVHSLTYLLVHLLRIYTRNAPINQVVVVRRVMILECRRLHRLHHHHRLHQVTDYYKVTLTQSLAH